MRILGALAGLALLLTILWDTFETIILPRRVVRYYFRLTRLFYGYTWAPWAAIARRLRPGRWGNPSSVISARFHFCSSLHSGPAGLFSVLPCCSGPRVLSSD